VIDPSGTIAPQVIAIGTGAAIGGLYNLLTYLAVGGDEATVGGATGAFGVGALSGGAGAVGAFGVVGSALAGAGTAFVSSLVGQGLDNLERGGTCFSFDLTSALAAAGAGLVGGATGGLYGSAIPNAQISGFVSAFLGGIVGGSSDTIAQLLLLRR
jgi:hypothetical protein